MKSIGLNIKESRKAKGLTQEELAELSKVNLRTIQRIENDNSEPRGKTLSLICDVLEINKDEYLKGINKTQKKPIGHYIINGGYLILLNIATIMVFAYLTLDDRSSLNSHIGAVVLSFFIASFIIFMTVKMQPIHRVIKFGSGLLCYIVLMFILKGFDLAFREGFNSGLFASIVIFIGVLYYGNLLVKDNMK